MARYSDTREASAELLRMVIQHMTKSAAPFHPESYAVWYEYAARTNPELRQAIDKALSAGTALGGEQIAELYATHIRGPASSEDRARELERLAREVLEQTKSAGDDAGRYNSSLDAAGEKLRGSADSGALADVVRTLVSETQRMRESTSMLQSKLEANTREISELRVDLRKARTEALVDPLTGIANRRGLDAAIRDAAAEDMERSCLIALDIDHFKKCNDSYGHLFGDKVIKAVSQVLVNNVKGQDTPARIGGEEFVVLLPGTPLEGARVLAERLRATIAGGRIRRGDANELVGNITISLGVAAREPGEDFEAFLKRSDEALYTSKRTGRNRVTVAPRAGETAIAA